MIDDQDLIIENESLEEEETTATENKFSCPNCGDINQDEVMFLCNTCSSDELIHKDGMYICPSCLGPGENFECLSCGSKEVSLKEKLA